MSNIIQLKKPIHSNDSLFFDDNSSFDFELTALPISALLFIEEYVNPSSIHSNYESKIKSQLEMACSTALYCFNEDVEICDNNCWFEKDYGNVGKVFHMDKIPNLDYFNLILSKMEIRSCEILDDAMRLYVQAFYNHINNPLENNGFFMPINQSRKNALKTGNFSLIRILDELKKGKKLDFIPSNYNLEQYLVELK